MFPQQSGFHFNWLRVLERAKKVNFSPAPMEIFPIHFMDKIHPLQPLAPAMPGVRGGEQGRRGSGQATNKEEEVCPSSLGY